MPSLFRRKSGQDIDYKRPPLRQQNGSNGYGTRGLKNGWSNISSHTSKPLSWCAYVLLTAAFVFTITSIALYVNCSSISSSSSTIGGGGGGFEFIPKSRQLCHDLYQFLQTGRPGPLTWDYKESYVETVRIIRRSASGAYLWLSETVGGDLGSVQNSTISGLVACRDAIVRFAVWNYQSIRYGVQKVGQYANRAWLSVAQFTMDNFQSARQSITNTFKYHIPAYLEKMKGFAAK